MASVQNIALRSHRNETQESDKERLGSGNPCSFLALLEFRRCAGDLNIEKDFYCLHGGGKRVTYTSPTIQNELIACCAQVIREKVLAEVRESPFFSVLADEAADISK